MIKKGPSHGARHRNTERQGIYHAAPVAAKKGEKRGYDTMLERFSELSTLQSVTGSRLDGTHNAARKASKKRSQNHIGQNLEQPTLSKITNCHRMGRRLLRPLRRDCSRRSLICRDTGRAEMKILGSLYYTLRVITDLWINETIT